MKKAASPAVIAIGLAVALAPLRAFAHTGHDTGPGIVFDEAYRAHVLADWAASQQALARPDTSKGRATPKAMLRRPVQVASTASAFNLSALLSISPFTAPAGNGALMAASFAPFKPLVRYYWDGSTFYTESDNMPDNMTNKMVGITSWQQQIPLPTSYFASTTNPEKDTASLGYGQPNYWRLPLVATPAASPIPISAGNFQRGAVALAANGVAIFNPKNNTGRVSYEIGELDAYGGHCGLADDYHYHIIPTHLLKDFGGVLGNDTPVAWALDGYPIYGYLEPDGTARLVLDADGGHSHGAWGYHYHAVGTTAVDATHPYGTPQSPYLMNNFHGTVVNYGGQVDGQPEVGSMRASGTGGYTAQPVSGASIIAYMNPVALTTDGSGNLLLNAGGTASQDQYLMRVSISGTSYDECWQINRNVNPKTVTVTWRLPGATTTTTYASVNSRLTTYPMAAWSETKLPDTGQTLVATGTFGEDSDYTINPPAFTDNGDGTITDNVTGLMWQKTDNGESTWATAVSNTAGISTGGHTDWRLPTPAELFSIQNHNNGNPALNTTYFPSNPSGAADYWWTGDIYGTDAPHVWCTNAGGGLGPKPITETISAGGVLRYSTRYVRGGKSNNGHNYINNNDGTITDADTSLMWTQLPAAAMNWNSALSYAENLALAGYTDWRLPNVKELQTLTDYTLATASTTVGILPSMNRSMFARTLTNCTTTSGSAVVTCDSTAGLIAGMPLAARNSLTGAAIAASVTVNSVTDSTHFVMSSGATSTSTGLTLTAMAPPTAYWSSSVVKAGSLTQAWLVEFGINNSVPGSSGPTRNAQGIISYELFASTYPVFAVRTTSVATQIAVEQPSGSALTDGVSTVSYGNVNVGSASIKTFVIRNTGSTSLTISGTTIDGTNAANFTVTTAPAASIAAAGSTTMNVQFSAASAGTKTASLHVASSDTAVGAAFDITLSGTGYIPPPTVTNVTTSPSVPTNSDTPYVTATITPASGATISQVQLTYSTGAVATTTVFNETMTATATTGTNGWDGTGAIYPWTPVTKAGAGNIKQTTAANHTATGAGNPCGLELSKGSATASDTMVTTTNAVNASSTSAYVEFWVATSNVAPGLGWTFQLAGDGTTFNTRLSELTGSVHGYQLYHYDLIAAEQTSALKMQFLFTGNGTGGPTAPKVQIDDITVVSTAGLPPVTITMYDDGLHGDGAAGDGVFGAQVPAEAAGTTVSYSIIATDSNGSTTTLSSAGSYTTGLGPTITTSSLATATLGGAYSQTLTASSGTPGYTWSVSAGALPAGLALSPAGVISGTASIPGTYNFTATATDRAGRIGIKALSLIVSPTTAPNVLIVLTDDQGWGDIGYHTASGQVPVQTPNIDSIGTQGIRLEKCYVTAVCAVTRSCLLTGRNTLRTNCGNTRGLDLSEHLMPQTFKTAGYQTYMIGKWHIGGWDNNINTSIINGSTIQVIQEGDEYLPFNRGWDVHKGQYGGSIGYFSHQSVDPGRGGLLDWWLNGAPVIESTDAEGNGGYSTDLLADKAVALIQNRNKTRPMLMYLPFNGVHAGVQAPQSYINKYAGLGVTDTTRRTLCAAVDCMDVALGRVLAALDSEGITNNTLVILMSDNGGDTTTGSINLPLRGTKGDSYDGGIHTPASMRWPGVLPSGVTSDQYVWVGDIFPTICAATGVAPQNTKPFDGINLWPALLAASNSTVVPRPVPLVTATNSPVGLDTFTDPVNGGSKIFKLIRSKSGSTVTNQLFNMTGDPYETTDLLLGANALSYASIVATLTADITSITVENYAPYIGAAPVTQSAQQGGAITLYAPFTAYNKTPAVQWRMNSTTLSGATSYFQVTDSTSTAVNGVYMATLTLNNLNSTHTGSYDVIVTNTTGSVTSQAGTLTVSHPVSTLGDGLPDTWKTAHGIDPTSIAVINGPLGDIDGDGRPNLLEYAFNTDPKRSELDPVVTSTNTGWLQISYPRRIGALDLLYTLEVSTDLASWSSDASNFQVLGTTPNADGVTETVTVHVLPAIASTAKKFARVRVAAQ